MNEQQFNNCVTLAKYLLSLPEDYEHFGMDEFYIKPKKLSDNMYTWVSPIDAGLPACGTVACALGHGPAAGIVPEEDVSWIEYCAECFGIFFGEMSYGWCFDCDWTEVDNTPQGASKRIAFLLEKGHKAIPDEFAEGEWSASIYSDYEPNWDDITWDKFKNTLCF